MLPRALLFSVRRKPPAVDTCYISPTYRFNLLRDPDDKVFVDCDTTARAACLFSHDRDFPPLKDIDFPKVVVVDTATFRSLLFPPQ